MTETLELRTNDWLASHLAELWRQHFGDVPKLNEVYVQFGRRSRTRLGSITLEQRGDQAGASVITVSGYMRLPEVPDYVISTVLAHELVHYSHGFHSPLPRLCRYPHQGGIVDKELRRRGLTAALRAQKNWIKDTWPRLIERERGPIRTVHLLRHC